MKIGFAGLSHLGIVSSIAAASKTQGNVLAYDPDAGLCGRLAKGQLPVSEPKLPELLKTVSSQIRFSSDASELKDCDLVVISPDVLTDEENRSDLRPLEHLLGVVEPHLKSGASLVVLSQVPPGWVRKRKKPGVSLYYQVETLIFGQAVDRALNPERIIVGCSDKNESLPPAYESFLKAFGCPVFKMSYESAELAKISINLFLVSSVSMTNTFAEICEKIGAVWTDIVPALRADKRIGPHAYLNPGLGLSGGNLERDLISLNQIAADSGSDGGIVDAYLANSRYRRDWPFKMLRRSVFSTEKKPLIALWGLAYKQDTHSTKNSPAIDILKSLSSGRVRAYDPQVPADLALPAHAERASSALKACEGADALVIMTAWKEFSGVQPEELKQKMKGRVIVDPLKVLDGDKYRSLGFLYFAMGETANV